jgi:hypothetical protein
MSVDKVKHNTLLISMRVKSEMFIHSIDFESRNQNTTGQHSELVLISTFLIQFSCGFKER